MEKNQDYFEIELKENGKIIGKQNISVGDENNFYFKQQGKNENVLKIIQENEDNYKLVFNNSSELFKGFEKSNNVEFDISKININYDQDITFTVLERGEKSTFKITPFAILQKKANAKTFSKVCTFDTPLDISLPNNLISQISNNKVSMPQFPYQMLDFLCTNYKCEKYISENNKLKLLRMPSGEIFVARGSKLVHVEGFKLYKDNASILLGVKLKSSLGIVGKKPTQGIGFEINEKDLQTLEEFVKSSNLTIETHVDMTIDSIDFKKTGANKFASKNAPSSETELTDESNDDASDSPNGITPKPEQVNPDENGDKQNPEEDTKPSSDSTTGNGDGSQDREKDTKDTGDIDKDKDKNKDKDKDKDNNKKITIKPKSILNFFKISLFLSLLFFSGAAMIGAAGAVLSPMFALAGTVCVCFAFGFITAYTANKEKERSINVRKNIFSKFKEYLKNRKKERSATKKLNKKAHYEVSPFVKPNENEKRYEGLTAKQNRRVLTLEKQLTKGSISDADKTELATLFQDISAHKENEFNEQKNAHCEMLKSKISDREQALTKYNLSEDERNILQQEINSLNNDFELISSIKNPNLAKDELIVNGVMMKGENHTHKELGAISYKEHVQQNYANDLCHLSSTLKDVQKKNNLNQSFSKTQL